MSDQKNVVPFGKHKGKDVMEVIDADPSYIQWLVAQNWFRDRFVTLHQTIINRGAEPEETPEHNAIQVMFLDDGFCLKFCQALVGENRMREALDRRHQWIREGTARSIEQAEREVEISTRQLERYSGWKLYQREHDGAKAELARLAEKRDLLDGPITQIDLSFERKFEEHGVDVQLKALAASVDHPLDLLEAQPAKLSQNNPHDYCRIEIKPGVSDDYPAVLRQMKRSGSDVLLLKTYAGQGATREQFIKTFEASGIRVIFLDDITDRP